MTDYSWICPHCNRDVTITENDKTTKENSFGIETNIGFIKQVSTFIRCPNKNCHRFSFHTALYTVVQNQPYWTRQPVFEWQLVPTTIAQTFPEYIPSQILDDYNEACLIMTLSPKASATLSRRCLQGIIRDFWQVKPSRLVDEINQIQDRVEQLVWDAIDSVRKIGNVGAHMEKDINLIIDVEPDEAKQLIHLIEFLLKEWYVRRKEQEERLLQLKSIANSKK